MILEDTWAFLEKEVYPVPSTPELFNQYNEADNDKRYDSVDGAKTRMDNLLNYVKSFSEWPNVLIVGEAPGPNGVRFSGVPFTTEVQLCEGQLPFKGMQSSKNGPYPTDKRKGKSASIFWSVMRPYHPRFFAWNCIPFHPHCRENSLSIRTPSKGELHAHMKLLSGVCDTINPKKIVAVGRTAQHALDYLGSTYFPVPHPARRKREFQAGIIKALGDL